MYEVERWKREAAEAAVELVRPGMVLGLGHGSTARYALLKIAELLRSGKLRDIQGVPCSKKVEEEARALGIPLTTLEEHPELDLTIDGADEIDPNLNVIKGGGGAMTQSKYHPRPHQFHRGFRSFPLPALHLVHKLPSP